MSSIQGVICPNCGIHHNSPEYHKCKWSNPKSAQNAMIRFQLKKQHYKCFRCRRQINERVSAKHPRDDQYVYQDERCICVACSDCLRERRTAYDAPDQPDIIRT